VEADTAAVEEEEEEGMMSEILTVAITTPMDTPTGIKTSRA